MHLIYYFDCIIDCEDVREQNKIAFQLRDLQKVDVTQFL